MGGMRLAWALSAAAVVGVIAVLAGVWASRRRLGCMAGMTVAMALGMVTGLLAGALSGAVRPRDLWGATATGVAVGALVGGAAGAPVGLMALLDGTFSGLMGGMMGAMLGVMAPDRLEDLATYGATLVLGTAVLTLVLTLREVGVGFFRVAIQEWLGSAGLPFALVATTAVALLVAAVRAVPPESGADRTTILAPQLAAAPEPSVTHHGAPGDATRTVPPGPPAAPTQPPVTRSVREVLVRAREFAFDAPVIQVTRGERVRLRFANLGKAEHDLNVVGLKARVLTAQHAHGTGAVHAHALPGQEAVVEFIPLESGVFTAVCTLPGHERLGMRLQVAVR